MTGQTPSRIPSQDGPIAQARAAAVWEGVAAAVMWNDAKAARDDDQGRFNAASNSWDYHKAAIQIANPQHYAAGESDKAAAAQALQAEISQVAAGQEHIGAGQVSVSEADQMPDIPMMEKIGRYNAGKDHYVSAQGCSTTSVNASNSCRVSLGSWESILAQY